LSPAEVLVFYFVSFTNIRVVEGIVEIEMETPFSYSRATITIAIDKTASPSHGDSYFPIKFVECFS